MSDPRLDVQVSMKDAGNSIDRQRAKMSGFKAEAVNADKSVKQVTQSTQQMGQTVTSGAGQAATAMQRMAGMFGVTVGAAAALRLATKAINDEYEALAKGINDAIAAQLAFNALKAQEKGGYVPAGTVAMTERLSQEYEARGVAFQAEDIAAALSIAMPQAKELGMTAEELTTVLAEMWARSGASPTSTLAEQAQMLSMVLRSGSLRSAKGFAVSEQFAEDVMGETNTTLKAQMVIKEMQRQFAENSVLEEVLTSQEPFVKTQLSKRSAIVEKERLGQREAIAAIDQENEYQRYIAEARKRGIDYERFGSRFEDFSGWAESKKLDPKSAFGEWFRYFESKQKEPTILEWLLSKIMSQGDKIKQRADDIQIKITPAEPRP